MLVKWINLFEIIYKALDLTKRNLYLQESSFRNSYTNFFKTHNP